MSDVIYASKYANVSFPNPSISADKWFFSDEQEERLGTQIATYGTYLALFVAALVAGSVSHAFPTIVGAVSAIVVFIVIVAISVFFLSSITAKIVDSRINKRNEYRAHHAATLVDALAENGWWISNNNPVETIIRDDRPYLRNKNGVRYQLTDLWISENEIYGSLVLHDIVAEQVQIDDRREQVIAEAIEDYENANGAMNADMKAGFIAALEKTL